MSAETKNVFKSTAIKLCAGGLTIVVAGLGYLFAAPKTYRAVAKVEILRSGWKKADDASSSFRIEKLPGECQTARSDAILDRVVSNLNLSATWAKQMNQNAPLTTEQARQRLREMLEIQPAPGTVVIEIAARGKDPFEAAQIVNEIARLYSEYRQASRQEASHQGINSLKAKWDAQNKKIDEAQAVLDKLAYEFNMERATNPIEVYDAGALQALRAQRAALEEDYQKQSEQLDKLKTLGRDELRRVLLTNGPGTNALLAAALQQLALARTNLSNAQATNGADAPQTKTAKLVVDELDSRVEGIVNTIISVRQGEVTSLKATLSQIEAMSAKAALSTNEAEQIKVRNHLRAQDDAYAKAKAPLDQLLEERDELEKEILQSDLKDAVMPDAITARIVDMADPPRKPVSPDPKIAGAAFVVGGVIAGAGLLLLVLLHLKPRGVETKAS